MDSLAQALEIIQAARDAFEGIGGAGVLLDDEPFAACGLRSSENFRDVQISMAYLRKLALAGCCDGKIFHMQKWQATSKAAACFGRITASRLNPGASCAKYARNRRNGD
jgi:hypothetical protein